MASSYTTNTGIEKPGSGEQSGTWGATTNTNFDIIDQALHGQVSLAITGSRDLTTSDGAQSDGANPVIVLTGTPGSTFELRVDPTDQEKFYTIRNETNAACRVIYKGVTYSTSNGVEIAAGSTQAVTGDGQGVNGVFKSLTPNTDLVGDTSPQLGGNLDLNSNDITGTGNINTTGTLTVSGAISSGAIGTGSANITSTGTVQGGQFTLDNSSNDWTFTVSSNKLIISYSGTAKMELDTGGNLKVTGDVTAFGTI